ncbi:flagellar hook-basal body protein [Helicobacter cetorum]|uniref:flagellar hook-basal body protein n=1 Tax=Helicobacter cetorum TaxID=138563 RepID=UPI000CF061BB|nr:flagellar hook-basal body protein [Helicobacter cetorum]
MQNGYYVATGAMVTQFNRLDLVSNNLANLNTNSFKRDDSITGDFLRLYQEYRDQLPLDNQTKDAAQYLNRNLNRVPILSEIYTDKSLGALQQTDNSLDFALTSPNLYFAVETPQGVAYTRNGSFSIDKEGFLVTQDGLKVLSRSGLNEGGGIMMMPNAQIEVDKNGNINFRDNNELIQAGSLALVSFSEPKMLKKIGQNLYTYESKGIENVPNSGALRQFMLEKSNVNAVREMTNLIEINRMLDMYSKVLKTHQDDLNAEAINKLATRA